MQATSCFSHLTPGKNFLVPMGQVGIRANMNMVKGVCHTNFTWRDYCDTGRTWMKIQSWEIWMITHTWKRSRINHNLYIIITKSLRENRARVCLVWNKLEPTLLEYKIYKSEWQSYDNATLQQVLSLAGCGTFPTISHCKMRTQWVKECKLSWQGWKAPAELDPREGAVMHMFTKLCNSIISQNI